MLNLGLSVNQLMDEGWKADEEKHAQALWDLEDSDKRAFDVSYRFGKVAKEPFRLPSPSCLLSALYHCDLPMIGNTLRTSSGTTVLVMNNSPLKTDITTATDNETSAIHIQRYEFPLVIFKHFSCLSTGVLFRL